MINILGAHPIPYGLKTAWLLRAEGIGSIGSYYRIRFINPTFCNVLVAKKGFDWIKVFLYFSMVIYAYLTATPSAGAELAVMEPDVQM